MKECERDLPKIWHNRSNALMRTTGQKPIYEKGITNGISTMRAKAEANVAIQGSIATIWQTVRSVADEPLKRGRICRG
jgi:hypothetical protein